MRSGSRNTLIRRVPPSTPTARIRPAESRQACHTSAARRSTAALWVATPKLTGSIRSDLTRDHGWESVIKAGLRPVFLIALDETRSALRFRRKEPVKKTEHRP